MLIIAVVAALAAGACFAVGGVLQQREASTRPPSESLSPRLLLGLARSPAWLAGIGSTASSFGFKAVALAFGPLSVVQPLIASELVFAVPVSVRRYGLRLHLREWDGIAAVTVGLGLGIYSAAPQRGNPLPSPVRWGAALGALAVLAVVSLVVARQLRGSVRASLYALAAVGVLAAQSVLLAATVALFRQGIVTALSSWQPYAMALVSVVGLTLVQSAYQAGPLAASMPVMDAANSIVGIIIGIVLFHERIATAGWHLAGAAPGVALLVGGITLVDTSPLVRRVQRVEQAQQQAQEGHEVAEAPTTDPLR